MLLSLVTAALVSAVSIVQTKYNSQTSQWESINGLQQETQEETSSLLDIKDFFYKIKPDSRQICAKDVYLLVIVQSKPEHFKERELIRETWGSSGVHKIKLKLIFLMGEYSLSDPEFHNWNSIEASKSKVHRSRSLNRNGFSKTSSDERDRYKAEAVDQLVKMESLRYQDIVQGNFVDSSGNLTYIHVMGYKWVTEECLHKPTFVLKTNDNVFVEMNHLLNFLNAVYGKSPNPSLICDVVPAGTAPHKPKFQHHLGLVNLMKKETKPKYCSGSAYLISPSLMPLFLKATKKVHPVPMDDVYMMGFVREYLGISPFYLNLRYTYETIRPYKWLHSKNFQPLPFLFVVSDAINESDWAETVRNLWGKSQMIQDLQNRINT